MKTELDFLDLLQRRCRGPLRDRFFVLVSRIGDRCAVWFVLAFGMILFPSSRIAGLAVLAAIGFECLACDLALKPHVARVRPFRRNPSVKLLVREPRDFSFPSGHTGWSFAAVSVLFFYHSPLFWPALVLAVLMAWSRMYLYVHYPTDVAAGAALGTACGGLAFFLIG